MEQAKRTLDRIYSSLRGQEIAERNHKPSPDFLAILSDDLNTPKALAEINRLAKEAANADNEQDAQALRRQLLDNAQFIGLLTVDPEAWFKWQPATMKAVDPVEVEAMINARCEARDCRNWSEADRLRDALTDMGVVLEDGPEGTRWRVTE